MKHLLAIASALVIVSFTVFADDFTPPPTRNSDIMVLIYAPGLTRPIEFTEVTKIINSDATQIIFETSDGSLVTHSGPYTILQAATESKKALR